MPSAFEHRRFALEFATPLTKIGVVTPGTPGVEVRARGRVVATPGGHTHF
jgi:hypothetical protein